MQTITKGAVYRIVGNQVVIGRLMALFNKSYFTISRWIANRDIRLSIPEALAIIKEETGMEDSEVLEVVTEKTVE